MYSREYLLTEDIYRAREAGRVWDRDSGSVGPREFPGCNSSTGFTLEESKATGLRRPSLAGFWFMGWGEGGSGSVEKGLLGECQ